MTRPMMEVSRNNNSVICKNTCFGNSAPQMLASNVKSDSIVMRMRMCFWREPTYVIYITTYVNKTICLSVRNLFCYFVSHTGLEQVYSNQP
jgi:hypothetical protein